MNGRKVLLFVSLLFGAGIFFVVFFNVKASLSQRDFQPIHSQIPEDRKRITDAIAEYGRTEESTYLTLPEWYLVFNPQEYAVFIRSNAPSGFPYFTSIAQFWDEYAQVYGITKRHYPFNFGNHLMLFVIGTSFTAEYAIKGVYENTVGRLSEWASGGKFTEEDAYAAKVAEEYGAFIPTDPWYEFPFHSRLTGLWTETKPFGPHLFRKWERKFILSVEYAIKTVYAKLIRAGSKAVYGNADTDVYLSVKDAPESIFQNPKIRKIKTLDQGVYVAAVPHYQGFTDALPEMARQGVHFLDIAGNDELLITIVAPRGWSYDLKEGRALFEMQMLTAPEQKRIAVQVPVDSLTPILSELEARGIRLEHLYDY